MARASKPGLIYLDTHVVCWLYEGRVELLSRAAADAIERYPLRVSPMVDLELQYLHEIGRISKGPEAILAALADDLDLQLGQAPFTKVVAHARALHWTRDPFDRLIVAEALVVGAQLVTRDQTIQAHCASALW